MSLKKFGNKTVVAAMSLLSIIVFLIILLMTTVKADTPTQQGSQASNVQTFKELVAKMIKEQSIKIQSLFMKIQNNAQTMLQTIKSLKQTSKVDPNNVTRLKKNTAEVESTIEKSIKADFKYVAPRSFTKHYTTSGYGASGQGHTGSGNYGPPTYHHHSIGFDPINIVVSMSLLSFLLQAIQGLLSRTRTPTPVVEARSLDFVQDWLTAYREKNWKPDISKHSKYPKKAFFKKYVR